MHHDDKPWVVPFLFWLAINLRLLFYHIPITIITRPMHWIWAQTGVRVAGLVPDRLKIPVSAAVVILVIMIGAFASPETHDNTRANRAVSLFGLLVFIAVLWATSKDRKLIRWHTVIVGMLFQFIIALFVLRTTTGYDIFNAVSGFARRLLENAGEGTAFLTSKETAKLPWFIVSVLPAIIFFVALVQLVSTPATPQDPLLMASSTILASSSGSSANSPSSSSGPCACRAPRPSWPRRRRSSARASRPC